MTRVCSRNLTQRPAFGGDDNAFPTCGLRIKARRFLWDTLSEHKWVILGERRGTGLPFVVFILRPTRSRSQRFWSAMTRALRLLISRAIVPAEGRLGDAMPTC